jgi:antitoxin YefM
MSDTSIKIKEETITNTRNNLIKLSKEMDGVLKVTSRNLPVLALLPWELFESIMETLEIMSDPELMQMLEKSKKEAENGELESWESVKESLSA